MTGTRRRVQVSGRPASRTPGGLGRIGDGSFDDLSGTIAGMFDFREPAARPLSLDPRHLRAGQLTVKFLAAVVLAVAVIVGLGMLWAHASGAGIGSSPRRAPSGEALLRLEQIKTGVIRVQSDNGFNLANTGNLIRTCEIEAVLAAVVIMVSAVRRQHRRTRRTAAAKT
jgi:hypothetical protein